MVQIRFVHSLLLLLTLGCLWATGHGQAKAEDFSAADYVEKIKPLLHKRCFSCHGSLKQEGDLRLDTASLMVEGGVITRGNPHESSILERVAATDIEERMPPEHEGEPLSKKEIELLRAWIVAGAPAPADEQPEADPQSHWSFQPLVRPAVPTVANSTWPKNTIDAFIAHQHVEQGLQPQKEASRILLIRRLYIDLTGVPPSAAEIKKFANDSSPQWYENTVEELLKDPRHGERWARHWMDVWRYSDWWGLGQQLRNSQKHIWHWRDWIIESLNNDLPYDEMVRQMLAADELYPNDLDKLRATGYLARNYFLFNRNQWMDETVEHVSKGFLGITMNCAKCHDHKFDPIEQVDFYKLRAVFEPYHVRLDMVPGETNLTKDGIPVAFDGMPDDPTYLFIRGQDSTPDKSTVIAPGIPEIFAFQHLKVEEVSLPSDAWQPARRSGIIEAHVSAAQSQLSAADRKLIAAHKKVDAANNAKPSEAKDNEIVKAQNELRAAEMAQAVASDAFTSVQRRAEAMTVQWIDSDKNAQASAAAAAVLAERQLALTKAKQALLTAKTKLDQAKDKKDDLTKKVGEAKKAVTQAESKLKSPITADEKFTPLVGAKWTPTRFFSSLKDDPTVKFHPKSTGRRTALAKWITDKRNPLTARVAVNQIWTRHMGQPLVATVFDFGRNGADPTHPDLLNWLASELIDHNWSMKHIHRLIVNSAAYRMDSSVAGREVNVAQDPDNKHLWRRVAIRLESQVVRDSILELAGSLDKTIGGPPVPKSKQDKSTRRSMYFFHSNNDRNLFLTMFDEARVKDCYKREQSIVPQQALALTNSKLVFDSSKSIAQQLSQQAKDDLSFIKKAFTVILSMTASDVEIKASLQAIESWKKLPDGSTETARANFVWALVNHNDFVTLR